MSLRKGRRTEVIGVLFAALAFAMCSIGLYFLSADARREIIAMSTASADATQWALAQSEVELLALLDVMHRDDLPDEEKVALVRTRFDVFYSRIATMRQSSVLIGLRAIPEQKQNLNNAAAELDGMIPLIDGPDAALLDALPELSDTIEELRPVVRAVSLAGVDYFSKLSDAQRERVLLALVRLGVLALILVTLLIAVAFFLLKSTRQARSDAFEKAEAEKRMAAIVNTSLDAIIVVDIDGRVIEFNKAAETIFGYARDEVINHNMADAIIPEKYHHAHETGMKRYVKTGEKRVLGQGRVQLEAKHKSGRIFPVELSLSNAEGPDGEIFISFLRDISTRVAKQEELVRARDEAVAGERAKANLVAVMSHEMRTPLNGIVGALELMKTTKLDKTQANMVDVMSTSSSMLLQHVNDVLDMSRLQAGAAEQIRRPFDPVAVISELLGSLKLTARERGNTIELTSLDPGFTRVLGDAAKLRQIMTNLVGNAIKFTRHGKISVEIEPFPDSKQWEIRVADDGIGIPPEHHDRIFEDFVTLDTSYTRAQEGTGLGLAIVKRLVAHLGGEISVDSTPGVGTCFTVRLPTNADIDLFRDSAQQLPAMTPELTESGSIPLRVLLIEDNAINRVVARSMLEKLGHEVIEAHNGAEGVKTASTMAVDAILMDISMPEMDGVQATRLIRSSAGPNADAPIFAVTAHAMPADRQRFEQAGMTDVLIKPIGLEALKSLLNSVPGTDGDTPTDLALWDGELVADLRDALGADRHKTLLEKYAAEMDHACATVFSTPDMSDPDALKAEVHRLAGSASMLGASVLRDLLHQIETSLAEGDLEAASEGLSSVSGCWSETRRAMPQPAD